MSAPERSIQITPAQAANIPQSVRNEFYSELLATDGIRNIEASLTHELQRCGWLDDLKLYIRQLLRSGEATTVDQVMLKVKEKIGLLNAGYANGDYASTTNGQDAGPANGVNGVNGHDAAGAKVDLTIPDQAVQRASATIRKELEVICEVTEG